MEGFEIAKKQARLGGIFITMITMYQKENDAAMLTEFQNVFNVQMMRTVIPYSRTVRESLKAGLPIEAYFIDKKVPRSPNSWKIVDAYESLAAETCHPCLNSAISTCTFEKQVSSMCRIKRFF